MGYRNSSKNVREIGKSLGAATVLEGSVRSGDLPAAALATRAHLFIEARILEGVAQEKLGQTEAARAASPRAKELAQKRGEPSA